MASAATQAKPKKCRNRWCDGAIPKLETFFQGFAWYPVGATFKTNVKHIDFRFARFLANMAQPTKGRCDVSPEVSSFQKLAPSICALSNTDCAIDFEYGVLDIRVWLVVTGT